MSRLPILLALGLGACSPNGKDVALDRFQSCGELQDYMRKMTRKEVRWDWGVRRGGFMFGGDKSIAVMDESAGGIAPQAPGARSFSTTNLQQAGVDEADLMKTDGRYLYTLAGGKLITTLAWPIEDARELSQVEIDGHPQGLYLYGDLLVVLSNLWWDRPSPRAGALDDWRAQSDGTVLTLVDISNPNQPSVLRETYFSGTLEESRRIGDQLFVVTYEDLRVDAFAGSRKDALRAVDQAKASDFLAVRADDVLQGGAWVRDSGPACDCQDTWGSDALTGSWISTVSQLDLSQPAGAFKASAVMGRADTVYASPSNLYLAYTIQQDTAFTGLGQVQDTIVHKFGLDDDAPSYKATARVIGVLTDPFGLSERDGVLRIATTDMEALTSGITTLESRGGRFKELDHIDGLAPGETITAARFVGKLGYLVTWEMQLGDPLFTFDLSDPSNLQLGGELAVTGWSDYLHPMDDDHLLAVGMDQTTNGSFDLAISLFDVSDLANPKLTDRTLLNAWGSEAQTEYHAFNYFPDTQSLTIPSNSYAGTVLEVLRATTEGIDSVGQIAQPTGAWGGSTSSDNSWCNQVRRSVVMEDKVWAISNAGLTAASLDTPWQVLNSVAYSGVDPCTDYGWFGNEVW